MPRPFSSEEKQRIRRALLENGRDIFASGGIRGTTIRQLSRAAGISPGAFYSFFASKEHLLLELVAEEERIIREQFARCIDSEEVTPSRFASCLSRSIESATSNPLIRRLLDEEELRILARSVDPQRLEAHIQGDAAFARPLIEELQNQGVMKPYPVEVIAGLLRGLMLFSLHRREIGEDIFDRVMHLMVAFVSIGLLEGESTDDRG